MPESEPLDSGLCLGVSVVRSASRSLLRSGTLCQARFLRVPAASASLNDMPRSLYDLDPGSQTPEIVRMIVEIPKNSIHKIEYSAEFGLFRLDRTLYSPMHYPGDYGFVPGTIADDGDPLDVLLMAEEGTFTGCLLDVRPIGALDMSDEHGRDQKMLAVPDRNPRYDSIHTVDQVFPHVRREIEHFFSIYKELEVNKQTEVFGWQGPQEARRLIVAGRERYLKKRAAAVPGENP